MSLQQFIKYTAYFLAGLFFAGALYDAVSNAISLIPPKVTYWGTGLLLVIWGTLVIYINNIGVDWSFPGGKKERVKTVNSQVHLFFAGLIFSLWLPIMIGTTSESSGKGEETPKAVPMNGSFSLTVFVHGSKGRQDIIIEGQGELVIDFGDDRRVAIIGENGRTVFSGIPAEFKDKIITIGLDAPGFSLKKPDEEYMIDQSAIYLELKKNEPEGNIGKAAENSPQKGKTDAKVDSCKVNGIVKDASSNLITAGASVVITCDDIFKTKTDKDGYFSLNVPGELEGEQCVIRVEGNGKSTEAYIPICDPNLVELKLSSNDKSS